MAEMSFRHLLNKWFSLSISGYYSWLSNLIAYETVTDLFDGKYKGYKVSTITRKTNMGKQNNYGGTVQLDYVYTAYKTRFAAFTYTDGTVETRYGENNEFSTDAEMDNLAPYMLRTGFDFKYHNFSISPRLQYCSEQRSVAFEKSDIPKNESLLTVIR